MWYLLIRQQSSFNYNVTNYYHVMTDDLEGISLRRGVHPVAKKDCVLFQYITMGKIKKSELKHYDKLSRFFWGGVGGGIKDHNSRAQN